MPEHIRFARNRRELLTDCFCGVGSLAFASMMAQEHAFAGPANPLAPKSPHIPGKAKAMIFVFMAGGPSHLETWDPKPLLNKLDGQKRPAEFGDVKYQNVNSASRILGTKRTFKKCGQSGIEVSDLFPHQSQVIDELVDVGRGDFARDQQAHGVGRPQRDIEQARNVVRRAERQDTRDRVGVDHLPRDRPDPGA